MDLHRNRMSGDSGEDRGGNGGKHIRCFLEDDSSCREGGPKRWPHALPRPYRLGVTTAPSRQGRGVESLSEDFVDVAEHRVDLASSQEPAEGGHAIAALRHHCDRVAWIGIRLQQPASAQPRTIASTTPRGAMT